MSDEDAVNVPTFLRSNDVEAACSFIDLIVSRLYVGSASCAVEAQGTEVTSSSTTSPPEQFAAIRIPLASPAPPRER